MKHPAISRFKGIAKSFLLVPLFIALVFVQIVLAGTTETTLNHVITSGVLSIDIVDGAGDTVASPSVLLSEISYSFVAQDTTGTLGTASEKIRVTNATQTETWGVNIAATSGPGTNWTTGTYTHPFDSTGGADSGRLTVNPSVGTLTAIDVGCDTDNISKGSSDYFVNGTTDSIDLLTAGAGADTLCRWDLTGVGLSQRVPASQEPGSYSLSMTLTAR